MEMHPPECIGIMQADVQPLRRVTQPGRDWTAVTEDKVYQKNWIRFWGGWGCRPGSKNAFSANFEFLAEELGES